MDIKGNVEKLKIGFLPSFWVANIMELFERFAYYGQAAILSVFLRNHLKFDEVEAGKLQSVFGGLIYFLPIFAGALTDKYGFKKAFSFAFLVLSIGYFLIGAAGINAFSSFFPKDNLFLILAIILTFTAVGGSFIKPSVLGTVAYSTTRETKSLGYAIYYWLVNIGGAFGPVIAYFVRDLIGIQYVYLVSAVSCIIMFLATLLFYKNPVNIESGKDTVSLVQSIKNLVLVLKRFKFIIFLLIFSLYWLMFWQTFIIIPFYITDFISKDAPFEIIESIDAWGIILLQLLVNRVTKKLSPITAIISGFLMSSFCWFIIAMHPGIPLIAAGLVVFAVGEMTQAPRYYEYIADLAPQGQTALFQGYAFLPIAIGWLGGGYLGGWLYKSFARETNNPQLIFFILFGIGLLATALMFIYNLFLRSMRKL